MLYCFFFMVICNISHDLQKETRVRIRDTAQLLKELILLESANPNIDVCKTTRPVKIGLASCAVVSRSFNNIFRHQCFITDATASPTYAVIYRFWWLVKSVWTRRKSCCQEGIISNRLCSSMNSDYITMLTQFGDISWYRAFCRSANLWINHELTSMKSLLL